jgi:hypothetical protein
MDDREYAATARAMALYVPPELEDASEQEASTTLRFYSNLRDEFVKGFLAVAPTEKEVPERLAEAERHLAYLRYAFKYDNHNPGPEDHEEISEMDAAYYEQARFMGIREALRAQTPCRCPDCGWQGSLSDLKDHLEDLPDLAQRLTPGETVPAGDCPGCRGFAMLATRP